MNRTRIKNQEDLNTLIVVLFLTSNMNGHSHLSVSSSIQSLQNNTAVDRKHRHQGINYMYIVHNNINKAEQNLG